MCGRFVLAVDDEAWAEIARKLALGAASPPTPRFNIAPTQAICAFGAGHARASNLSQQLCVRQRDLSFGMKLGDSLLINARSETLTEKPTFRRLLSAQRVVVLATAFYEWAPPATGERRKRPMAFARQDRRPFFFAALEDTRPAPRPGAVLVTTAANRTVLPSHGRMPVMLSLTEALVWLDPATKVSHALSLLEPYGGNMEAWPVGHQVNSVKNDTPDCLHARPPPVNNVSDAGLT